MVSSRLSWECGSLLPRFSTPDAARRPRLSRTPQVASRKPIPACPPQPRRMERKSLRIWIDLHLGAGILEAEVSGLILSSYPDVRSRLFGFEPRLERSMQTTKIVLVGVGALLCSLPPVAHGEIVTFGVEGTVHTVIDSNGWIEFAQVGDRLYYSITFDSEGPPSSAGWSFSIDAISASLQVGETKPIIMSSRISVIGPSALFQMSTGVNVDGHQGGASFALNQYTAGQFSLGRLPTEPYPLSDFENATFVIGFEGPYPTSGIIGEIDRFYLIPEPTTFVLLTLGGFMAGLGRRR